MSKSIVPPLELSLDGKIALIINQIQTVGAQLYIEQVNEQFLKTQTITGKPEYEKAASMVSMNIREMERKLKHYRATLDALLKERSER